MYAKASKHINLLFLLKNVHYSHAHDKHIHKPFSQMCIEKKQSNKQKLFYYYFYQLLQSVWEMKSVVEQP